MELGVEVQAGDTSERSSEKLAPKGSWVWRIVVMVAIALFCILNWVAVFPLIGNPSQQGAQDFSIFYTGSRIVRSGLSSHLYDLSVQAQYQTATYQTHPLPFNHPAYELILFLPFAGLSFKAAYWAWFAICIGIAGLVSRLVAPYLSSFPKPAALWVFGAAMASFPVIWALCQGQDSILLLLIFVLVYINLKEQRDFVAGLALAAGLFKFPLVVPFALAFLVRRQWRFVLGFLAGSTIVAGISAAITGIAGVREYVLLLSQLAANPSAGYINPLLMPNARGFLWMVLSDGSVSHRAIETVSAIASLILLVVHCVTFRGREHFDGFDLWFGVNLSVALLASPHLYWHDLTPLLLPLLLAINLALRNGVLDSFSLAVAAAVCVFAAAWLAYLVPLGMYPNIFFLPLGAFAFVLVKKLRSLRLHPLECAAIETPGS